MILLFVWSHSRDIINHFPHVIYYFITPFEAYLTIEFFLDKLSKI